MIHDCDLCGSADFVSLGMVRHLVTGEPPVVCKVCGFVYVRERRSSEEIAKAWDDIWGEGYSSSWPAVKARLYYAAEWLDQEVGLEGKSVLDIGAGEGLFLEFVRDRGGHPVGIEPFKDNVLKIRQKDIACFHGTAESVEPGEYDIVTLNWTLENCGDCIGLLERARSFLRPGGHVCVATGSRILVPFKKPLSTYFSRNPADTHCFRFSRATLEWAFCKVGFYYARSNPFRECDWLIGLGKKWPDTLRPISRPIDSPNSVVGFFERWQREFP